MEYLKNTMSYGAKNIIFTYNILLNEDDIRLIEYNPGYEWLLHPEAAESLPEITSQQEYIQFIELARMLGKSLAQTRYIINEQMLPPVWYTFEFPNFTGIQEFEREFDSRDYEDAFFHQKDILHILPQKRLNIEKEHYLETSNLGNYASYKTEKATKARQGSVADEWEQYLQTAVHLALHVCSNPPSDPKGYTRNDLKQILDNKGWQMSKTRPGCIP